MNRISRILRTSLAVGGLAALAVAASPTAAEASGNVPGWLAFMGPQDAGCLRLSYASATNSCSHTISVQLPFEQENDDWQYSDVTVTGGGSGQSVNCAFYGISRDSTGFYRTSYVSSSIPFRSQTLVLGNQIVEPAGSISVHCLMDPGTSISNARAFHPG